MRLLSLPLLSFSTLLGATLSSITPALAILENTDEHSGIHRSRLRCKCLPDQPCWPSAPTWSSFNETVGGRLIATTPVARECHPSHYNKAKCDEIQQGYYFESWRQLQPGAVQMTNWETTKGQGCLLNQTTPCAQGAVPLFTVNVSTVTDVQETVRFAVKHNIRLVVKNTGHDYLGRSTAASAITLWTYFKRKIEVVDSFVPDGAPQDTEGTGAVVLESGVLWQDAYKEVDKHNRVVVGGMSPTVGASGGYCQGGGHSPLSPRHGLCVDNVLQYKVVTADGELRIANAFQNPDLYWALRGGGPGFGVVVEAVYRTHPAPKHLNYALVVVGCNDTAQMGKVTRRFFSHVPKWTNQDGWSGYTDVGKDYLAGALILPDADVGTARTSIQPFLDYVNSLVGIQVLNSTISQVPSFYAFFQDMASKEPARNAGFNHILGSRLIPRTMLESEQGLDLLTSTMRHIQEDTEAHSRSTYLVLMVAGGQVAKANAHETSVVPAWRKAQVLINYGSGWNDDTPYAEQVAVQRIITKATDRLRKITPGGGTYQNEADPNEPNFQQAFFGANYPRLYQLKHKYDPSGLFVCRRCVGSEDWSKDEMCPRHR